MNSKPIHLLHKQYFLCCEHFNESKFTNFEKSRFKKNAIPTIFGEPVHHESLIPKDCDRNEDCVRQTPIDCQVHYM